MGVVGDVRHRGMGANAESTFYIPHRQADFRAMTVIVRTAVDPTALTPELRARVWDLDGDLAITGLGTAEQWVARSVAEPRYRALLFGLFAVVAATLASIGIYGVMSFAVSRRITEMGIRMALGAEGGQVLRLVLRQGVGQIAIGLGLGLALAFLLSRSLQLVLFQVNANDPTVFLVISLVLGATGLLASTIPARRATRVDPMSVLRVD